MPGYLVPSNANEVERVAKTICIPIGLEWDALYDGLINTLTNGYVWDKQSGDWEAAKATAFQVYLQYVGVSEEDCGAAMTCEQIIECIETDADVKAALLQYLEDNGFVPSPENVGSPATETLPASQSASNMLAGVTDCSNPATNMAIARAVVQELNESVQDAFEVIELTTNASEVSGIVVGAIPVVGTSSKVFELVNWFMETVVESYQAAYTQTAEDNLSCLIFCHMQDSCSLSLDDLLNIYENAGSITVPTIENIDDLIEFIVTTTISIDTVGVAVFQYFILRLMKFGGSVFDILGFNGIKNTIEIASTYLDYTYDNLCSDCPPSETATAFWMIYQDARQGIGEWVIGIGTQTGNGIYNAANVGDGWSGVRINDFGASFGIVATAVQQQRRGASAASDDICRVSNWTGANNTGTENVELAHTGISSNGNNVVSSARNTITPANGRSPRILCTSDGAINATTNFVTIVRWVIYGNCNAGNVKPPQAVYVSAIPPIDELFPS